MEGVSARSPLKFHVCLDLFVSSSTVIYLAAVAAPFHLSPPKETFSSGWRIHAGKTRESSFVLISFRSSQLVPASPMAREASMGG